MTRITAALSVVVAIALPPATVAEVVVDEIDWASRAPQLSAEGLRILSADNEAHFERLLVENPEPTAKTVAILNLESPGVAASAHAYALVGQIRYAGVEGTAYLEMWSRFPGRGEVFSRTLSDGGPAAKIEGSSDWRPFALALYMDGSTQAGPEGLRVNVVLPGRGTVWLGPPRLVQYGPGEDPLVVAGQWWSERTAWLMGGIMGSVLGCVGALIGVLSSRGKARARVAGMLVGMLIVGAVALTAGDVALLKAQPYAVYYPLLLTGGLCILLPGGLLGVIRRRYQELELRKIGAADAV